MRLLFISKFEFCLCGGVFVGVVAGCSILEFLQLRIYESTAAILTPETSVGSEENSFEPWRVESAQLFAEIDFVRVIRRFAAEDRARLTMLGVRAANEDSVDATAVLKMDVRISRSFNRVLVSYRNRDAQVASRITQLLVDECLPIYAKSRVESIALESERHTNELTRQSKELKVLSQELATAQVQLVDSSDKTRSLIQKHCEELQGQIARNQEWRVQLDARHGRIFRNLIHAGVVDPPVLAMPENYVRTPIFMFLQWKWAIDGVLSFVGLVVSRRANDQRIRRVLSQAWRKRIPDGSR